VFGNLKGVRTVLPLFVRISDAGSRVVISSYLMGMRRERGYEPLNYELSFNTDLCSFKQEK